MGAAAGLKVDALDLDEADPAAGPGRPHRHGLDQLRAHVELLGIDPLEADRPVLGDPAAMREAMRPCGRGGLEVEVEPAAVRTDLTSRAGQATAAHRRCVALCMRIRR